MTPGRERAGHAALLIALVISGSTACATPGGARPVSVPPSMPPDLAVTEWEPGPELTPQLGTDVLRPAGGLVITAAETREHGGFSTLWVSPGCERIVAISDYTSIAARVVDPSIRKAGWIAGRLRWNVDGELIGLDPLAAGRLTHADGNPVLQVESMAVHAGHVYVSLDDRPQILAYEGIDPTRALTALPTTAVSELPGFAVENADNGLEAITTAADGRIVAIQECKPEIVDPAVRTSAHCRVWVVDPAADSVAGHAEPPVDAAERAVAEATYATELWPSGATTLPGGDLLVLERHWISATRTQSIRVVRLAADDFGRRALASRPLLDGDVWLDVVSADGSLDNFEGIAACRLGDRARVLLISDNNGDWRRALAGGNPQRTLLLALSPGER